jgi:hypothetical protein
MSILIESPWPAILFGIIGEAILAVMLLRTGRGVLLWAMAGVLALSLGGVAVERLVVTDRKLVAAVIYDTAAALEANDLKRVLAHVAPEDAYTHEQAALVLGQYEIVELKVRYLEITINRLTSPPTAKAAFNVIATGKDRRGEIGRFTWPGKLVVELRRDPDPAGWVITGHKLTPDPR